MAEKFAQEPKYRGALVDTMAVQVKICLLYTSDAADEL